MAWCLTVTSVLIMNSIDFLTMREQAKREQALFEDRALALGGERDQQAMEALAAQERFAAATVQMSSMQSDLLALETRRREMESELQAAQATLCAVRWTRALPQCLRRRTRDLRNSPPHSTY